MNTFNLLFGNSAKLKDEANEQSRHENQKWDEKTYLKISGISILTSDHQNCQYYCCILMSVRQFAGTPLCLTLQCWLIWQKVPAQFIYLKLSRFWKCIWKIYMPTWPFNSLTNWSAKVDSSRARQFLPMSLMINVRLPSHAKFRWVEA